MKKVPKIIQAKNAGFCFGVRRAVEMASEALKKEKVFCLGEIIHNPAVILELEKRGMKIIDDLKKVKSGEVVIVRSHGAPPAFFAEAKEKKIRIIDTTCPFVKKAQKSASDFQAMGRQVIIFGDPKHSEVIGIRGGAQKAIVVQDEKSARKLKNFSKVGILAQTTQKKDVFQKIVSVISAHSQDVKVAQTICLDSFKKKAEVKKIAQKVDVMIVVGGKNSNNTKKLAETSASAGTKTFHIENAQEIQEKWFRNVSKIGLSAGASTPDFSIEEVRERILKIISNLD